MNDRADPADGDGPVATGVMTMLPARDADLARLPHDAAALARIVQGLLLHVHWAPAYSVTASDERREETHLRTARDMLARARALDAAPLEAARPPERRVLGTCRDFAVLHTALLRRAGFAARARCGFAGYFTPGRFEDHWVSEVCDDAGRWYLFDAQLDELQRTAVRATFASDDVPRDRFLVAADAWQRCRAGRDDAARFGIFDMSGLWFVAGNVVRDAAALCDVEMLPWDCWGVMRERDAAIEDDTLAFLDRVAALTLDADAHGELRSLYGDRRLQVPARVFNALRQRVEPVLATAQSA